jgi:hypothetical protein
MRNPFLFFVDLAKQPLRVSVWVVILALANIASLLFWAAPVAKIIFLTFVLSAISMMILYSCFGFQKILGIAHIFWIYLVPFMLLQLVYANGIFFLYLITLSLLLTISLVIDAIDVWKYFREMPVD